MSTHQRKSSRGRIAILVLALAAPSLTEAQIQVVGKVRLRGAPNVLGQPSTWTPHPYTHIWVFAPPNGEGGAHDNSNFLANVMNNSAVPIDGVSILEAWNTIEKSAPDSSACVPSDLCQPDPVIPQTYHHYDWSTYDSTAAGNPVKQWLDVASGTKKVNILIAGAASGTTNPITPHYVTSPAWYNLFTIQQQDVINGIKDCGSVPWTGSTGSTVTATIVGSNVQVTDTNGCCGPPTGPTSQSSAIQDQDFVWVTTNPSSCGTTTTGAVATVASGSTTQLSYAKPTGCSGTITSVTYIGKSQSWPVPYEYPYKAALKAFWAAVIAHYGPNFSIGVTNYFSYLNYFRFGGSVGSEWFPYCTSSLKNLSAPYEYTRQASTCPVGHTCTGWLDYYKEMGDYLQSLGPPFKIVHSINTGDNDYSYGDAEADYAVTWSNRYGARDGFGSQGLSSQDVVNCTTPNDCDPGPPNSASDWYPAFAKHAQSGVPLELQPIALSDETNDSCSTTPCTPDTNSGDLQQFLPFAVTAGGTDFEIYWRDLSLAYDKDNYCSLLPNSCTTSASVSLGGQIGTRLDQNTFFQDVGQGGGTYCTGSGYQFGSSGDCSYQANIDAAHGQH